jgi:hypothetical protein
MPIVSGELEQDADKRDAYSGSREPDANGRSAATVTRRRNGGVPDR